MTSAQKPLVFLVFVELREGLQIVVDLGSVLRLKVPHAWLVRLNVFGLVRRVSRHIANHSRFFSTGTHIGKSDRLIHGLHNILVVDGVLDLFLFKVMSWLV